MMAKERKGTKHYSKIILWFGEEMRQRLLLNRYKTGWDRLSMSDLKRHLTEEVKELYYAMDIGDQDNIRKEAADVANFAMMIADRCKRCRDTKK